MFLSEYFVFFSQIKFFNILKFSFCLNFRERERDNKIEFLAFCFWVFGELNQIRSVSVLKLVC